MKLFAVFLFSSAVLFAQNTCLDFPSAQSIPFASIAYVTAANSAGDHLVVGSLQGGTAAINAINANIPLPAFVNQTFCGQVQLAPGQYYANVYVPTAAERTGNFPAFTGLLVNPATNQPYANGMIPAAQLGAVYAWRMGPVQAASAIQGWNPTGSMSVGRTQHAAVLLPTGKVLVVGPGTVAELYDPASGEFAVTGQTVYSHGPDLNATLLSDGRVLVVGGVNQPSSAELYDPNTGKFTATSNMLQVHSSYFTATLLKDGRVLVVGGFSSRADFSGSAPINNSGAEIYDPTAAKFTSVGPMATNRQGHTASLLPDGRVLIAGGTGPGNINTLPTLDSAEIFDPAARAFSVANPMQDARAGHIAASLADGRVLVAGGYGPAPQTAEIFDPATGRFTFTGGLNAERDLSAAALLSNGQVLVLGGYSNFPVATNSAELFNPATGTFTITGNMGVPRGETTATTLLDGRVLVTGGVTNHNLAPVASAELYTPVTQGLVTSQTGLTFRAAQSASAASSQNVAVLSSTDTISFSVSTRTFTGSGWLTATPSSGTSAPGAPPVIITITANPAGLAAQDYYGSVTLTPTDGKHPPVSVSVVLNIVPAGSVAAPAVSPSGLLFLAAPGATPQAQSVTVTNLTSSTIGFSATSSASWFTFTPKAAGLAAGQSATITVTPVLTGLTAGVYRGSITLSFSDKTTQTVDVLLVLSQTAATTSHAARASTACAATKLLPVFTSLGTGFATPVAWPNALSVQVVDDCGNSINSGNVSVSFSNGDAPLSLLSIGSGTWTGTWVPVHSSSTAFSVRADAQLPPVSGSVQVTGQVNSNPNVPLVAPGGVLSSGDYSSSPALGLLVSIFGSALADGQASAGSLPLPNQVGSTSVIVSGKQLPVLFVNDQQVNVLIPYDLAVNAPHQLIVQRGSAISVPVPIAIFDSQPAILATAGNGTGQGHIYKIDSSGNQILADANAPATAGDYLVIYTVGLGAVDPPVSAGDPAGSNPPSTTTAPVTLTIGGVQAPVIFSGLTPGSAGLYQVNAVVPPGIAPGSQVPVIVSVAGKSSASNIYMGIQ
ncbi:MAG TPA: hypothetical protein VKX49_23115 [Bryobacteraceae bacterium]|nr:hypothetical protein [Bryobacteraceae bacterium]